MSLPTQPPLEQAWQTLRASLEWTREFALVFVFCSNSVAKEALFRRADDLMRAQVRPLERPSVRQAGDYLQTLLPAALQSASAHAQSGLPLWLDLDGQPGDLLWDEKRAEFLHRLNERRASLVRAGTRAVVLALPHDWTKRAAEAAPDLWTIRQPTVFMGLAGGQRELVAATPGRSEAAVSDVAQVPKTALTELPLAVQRWQQAVAENPLAQHSVWDGAQTAEAALQAGHTTLALEIARQTKALAAQAVAKRGSTPERLRDLSVSISKLGGVAEALGQLEEAKSAYAEGQALAQQLIGTYGESVGALDALAYHTHQLGQLTQARQLYQRLALAMPHEPRYRRALDELGAAPAV